MDAMRHMTSETEALCNLLRRSAKVAPNEYTRELEASAADMIERQQLALVKLWGRIAALEAGED